MKMKSFDKRQLYALITIILGICVAGLYSSYALPKTLPDTQDSVPYEQEISNLGQYTITTGSTKSFDLVVKNNSTDAIKYLVYYELPSNSGIPSGFSVTKPEYSANDVLGTLDKNAQKVITVTITNSSTSDVTVNFSVMPGFVNSQITLGTGQYSIS